MTRLDRHGSTPIIWLTVFVIVICVLGLVTTLVVLWQVVTLE